MLYDIEAISCKNDLLSEWMAKNNLRPDMLKMYK